MDIGMVMAALGLHSAQLQQTIAMRLLKMNAQAEAAAVQTLLGAPAASPPTANLASGVGGSLDITA
jgi:hypothetical protein